MKQLRLLLPALTLMLAACSSMPGRESDIDAVLNASGLEAQLDWLRQPLQTSQTSGPLALIPDEWLQLVNLTVAETLQPQDIRNQLRGTLKDRLTATELAEVERFFRSGPGRKVVAVETGSSLATAAGDDLNTATLEALASATGVGSAVSRLAEHALNDVVDIALQEGCLGQERTPLASLLGGVVKKAQLLALRNAVNERIRARYASLTPEEQETYLEFARSRAGEKFFSARQAVMSNAAQRAGVALNSQLTPRLSELCKSPG